jgi:hypothetical protein
VSSTGPADWFDRMRKAAMPMAGFAPGPELLLFGPAQAIQMTAAAVKLALVGRRRRFVIGGREITTEIVDLAVATGPGLAIGQFDDVRLDLSDLDWDGRMVSTLRVTGRNVHLRPGLAPTIVAAPILLEATVDHVALESWSTPWARRFRLEIGDDAVARIHVRGREHLGALEVDVRIENGSLVIDPTAIVAGRRRFGGIRRLPAFRVPLLLPKGIRLTELSLLARAISVSALVPEWSESLVITDVQQFARRLRADLDPVIVPVRRPAP